MMKTLKSLVKKTVNEKFWELLSSEKLNKEIESGILYSNENCPFAEIQFPTNNSTLSKTFGQIHLLKQHESVTVINSSAFIEPQSGWIICHPFHLVKNCLIDSSFAKKPSFKSYLKARYFLNSQIVKVPAAISLRDRGECNYWHFFNDILGSKLGLAERCDLSPDIPIIISNNLYQQAFFQSILNRSELKQRNFIIQRNQLIQSEKVFFFQTSRHSKENIEYVLKLLNIPNSNQKYNKRIFLTRSSKSGRNIININAVEDVCRKFKFEITDTSKMSLEEQIQLFSEARYVIGIHGAGLTNIIFRKNAMLSLLEIFPPMSHRPNRKSPPPHYFWLACALNFEYDLIFGEEGSVGDYRSPFELNVVLLEEQIKKMLN